MKDKNNVSRSLLSCSYTAILSENRNFPYVKIAGSVEAPKDKLNITYYSRRREWNTDADDEQYTFSLKALK